MMLEKGARVDGVGKSRFEEFVVGLVEVVLFHGGSRIRGLVVNSDSAVALDAEFLRRILVGLRSSLREAPFIEVIGLSEGVQPADVRHAQWSLCRWGGSQAQRQHRKAECEADEKMSGD